MNGTQVLLVLLLLVTSTPTARAAEPHDGTLVAVEEGQIPVQYLQPGDRVATFQGKSSQSETEPWLKISFRMKDKVRNEVRVAMLRTKEWVEHHGGYKVGETHGLKVLALGLFEDATVLAVEPVKLQDAPGRVVGSVVTYRSDEVFELRIKGHGKNLALTAADCLFSLDRKKWTPVRELEVGERLQTAGREVTIFSSRKLSGLRTVHGLNVEGDGEYLVGEAMLRARSICPQDS